MQWLKEHKILLLIVVIGIFLRFLYIHSVPVSSNDDQIHYILNSQSFLINGKDITSTVSPLDLLVFKYPPHETPQAELPYFLEMFSFSLFGASFFSSLLPNIVLSILTIVIAYGIGKELISKHVGLIAALATAINPWSIFIGRTAYEVVPATFFYLVALYLFLKAKKWAILVTIPFLALAFYSYIGTKLILVPFVIACSAFVYLCVNKRKYLIQYLTVIAASLALSGFFFFQISHSRSSRIGDLLLPTNIEIQKQVNDVRHLSLPSPLLSIETNKLTIYSRILTLNAFNSLSPTYLFLNGDYFFSQQRHGLLYLIDAVFLIIGFVLMAYQKKKELIFLGVLGLIGLIPQALHDPTGNGTFTPHITITLTVFIIIISYAIDNTIDISKRKIQFGVMILFSLIYLLSLTNFMFSYLTQAPKQAGIFNFSERVAARYVTLASKNNPVVVVASDPAVSYRNYIFYSGSYMSDNADAINSDLTKRDKYEIDNIKFVSCSGYEPAEDETIVEQTSCAIKKHGNPITISELSGVTTRYAIYQDTLCKNIKLNMYNNQIRLSDLNVEKFTDASICKKLLSYY